jgi:hypothetical protein
MIALQFTKSAVQSAAQVSFSNFSSTTNNVDPTLPSGHAMGIHCLTTLPFDNYNISRPHNCIVLHIPQHNSVHSHNNKSNRIINLLLATLKAV